MLALGIRIILAYLLGSLIGSLIVGQLRGGMDIRTQGSGNAGGTNALRTQGKVFALWVMFIDVGKGVLAAGLLPWIPLPFLHGVEGDLGRDWVSALCGIAAVIGHVYPVWFGFRGGKGAATFIGVLVTLAPLAVIPALVVWAMTVMLTGYVGLSTILAAWSVPVYALTRYDTYGYRSSLFAFGLAMAVFILFTHRSNIVRLLEGTENRFQRAMLLRRRH